MKDVSLMSLEETKKYFEELRQLAVVKNEAKITPLLFAYGSGSTKDEKRKKLFEDAKEGARCLVYVTMPLVRVLLRISTAEIHLINRKQGKILSMGNFPLLSVSAIYNDLLAVSPAVRELVFREAKCPYSLVFELSKCVEKADYAEFCRLFDRLDEKTQYMVSNNCWDVYHVDLNAFYSVDNPNVSAIDNLHGITVKDRDALFEKWDLEEAIKQNPNSNPFDSLFNSAYSDSDLKKQINEFYLAYEGIRDDIEEHDRENRFTPAERQIIDEIVLRPQGRAFLSRYERKKNVALIKASAGRTQLVTKSTVKDIPSLRIDADIKTIDPQKEEFALPDDFFEMQIDRSARNEYFDIENNVAREGPQKFQELIEYIVSEGFISNDYRSRRLFAYVLTGKWKPEDYQTGETITWSDGDHEGKEISYLIKSLIVSDQGKRATKYKKMHKLFTGPRWSKTPDKNRGNNAPKKFKEALHDLYPKICKL